MRKRLGGVPDFAAACRLFLATLASLYFVAVGAHHSCESSPCQRGEALRGMFTPKSGTPPSAIPSWSRHRARVALGPLSCCSDRCIVASLRHSAYAFFDAASFHSMLSIGLEPQETNHV
jgi:hypothetical protein